MKFECRGEVFIRAVQQVARARSKNQAQNYLQDIHIELDTHLLTLRSTNLEIFCEKSIPVKGLTNGSCILQGEAFLRILSTYQSLDAVLVCEAVEGVFSITTDKGVVEIKTTPYEDFPTLPAQGELIGNISKEEFLLLLKEVSFCASTTDIKPEIASVYVYTKNDLIHSVATDSYRLAEKTTPNTNGLDFSILIPQKHIGDIIQILQDEEDLFALSKNENIFSISTSTLTLSIHTVTGHFPDYKQLFPREFTTKATVSKEELQKALTLTTYFNEHYSQVECVFTEGKAIFHSRNEAIGQVTHSIQATKEGDDMEVKYNNKYFLDVISHIEGGAIVCMFTTSNKPVFIQGTKDISFTYLLMPLNR